MARFFTKETIAEGFLFRLPLLTTKSGRILKYFLILLGLIKTGWPLKFKLVEIIGPLIVLIILSKNLLFGKRKPKVSPRPQAIFNFLFLGFKSTVVGLLFGDQKYFKIRDWSSLSRQ